MLKANMKIYTEVVPTNNRLRLKLLHTKGYSTNHRTLAASFSPRTNTLNRLLSWNKKMHQNGFEAIATAGTVLVAAGVAGTVVSCSAGVAEASAGDGLLRLPPSPPSSLLLRLLSSFGSVSDLPRLYKKRGVDAMSDCRQVFSPTCVFLYSGCRAGGGGGGGGCQGMAFKPR